jgi:hypothetical protein
MQADAGLPAREHLHPTGAAVVQRWAGELLRHHHGDIDLRGKQALHAVKPRLGDADDGQLVVIDQDLLADDVAGSPAKRVIQWS